MSIYESHLHRAKEDATEKPGLPEAPSATVVNQPAPANVSLEIAEKLNQAKEEVKEEDEVEEEEEQMEEVEGPSEAVSDGEGVSLDHDSNQSIHLSGENIALDDDCDEGEVEEEEEKATENKVVLGSKLQPKSTKHIVHKGIQTETLTRLSDRLRPLQFKEFI